MNSTPIIYYHRNSQPINSSFGRNRKKNQRKLWLKQLAIICGPKMGVGEGGQEKWRKRR